MSGHVDSNSEMRQLFGIASRRREEAAGFGRWGGYSLRSAGILETLCGRLFGMPDC